MQPVTELALNVVSPTATQYCCPGESQPISRAIHLGRLAEFYPACRNCPHRGETGTLSPRRVRQLDNLRQQPTPNELFFEEGVQGLEINQLDPATVNRLATAFAFYLTEGRSTREHQTEVVIAFDGRSQAADLLEAAAEGLRSSGCNVVELGPATAPALQLACARLSAGGGLLVGNAPGGARTVSLKFWGPGGEPLSMSTGLKTIRTLAGRKLSRPGRRSGHSRRIQIDHHYLDTLRSYFHALRPLRIAIDCSCPSVWRYLTQLAPHSACQFIKATATGGTGAEPHAMVWIDGDGEQFRLSDEQGRVVPSEQVFLLLAGYQLSQTASTRLVVEESTDEALVEHLVRAGAEVLRSPGSRAAMATAMQRQGAQLGGGTSSWIWHPGRTPMPDALRSTCLLLSLLSTSDRPLSEVVEATIVHPVV